MGATCFATTLKITTPAQLITNSTILQLQLKKTRNMNTDQQEDHNQKMKELSPDSETGAKIPVGEEGEDKAWGNTETPTSDNIPKLDADYTTPEFAKKDDENQRKSLRNKEKPDYKSMNAGKKNTGPTENLYRKILEEKKSQQDSPNTHKQDMVIENLKRELEKKNKENEDLKTENASKTEEINRYKKRMDELETEKQSQEKQLATLRTNTQDAQKADKAKIIEKEKKIQALTEKIKTHTTDNNNSMIEELGTKLKKIQRELENTKEERDFYIEKITKKAVGEPKQATEDKKERILFLGDSNMENLKQHCSKLTEYEWIFKRLFTAEEVDNFLTQPTGKQTVANSNLVILLTGTNHIRRNEDLEDIFKKINNAIRKIPDTMPKIILEIPPWKNDRERTFNSKLLNITIHKLEDSIPNTKVCRYRSILDLLETSETMYDESHINRTNTADIIMKELKNTINLTDFATPPAPGKQIPIPAEKAGKVIGKFQTNLKHWTKQYNVTINLTGGETPSLTIVGKQENIKKVEEEIRQILTTTETKSNENYQTRERRHQNPTPQYATNTRPRRHNEEYGEHANQAQERRHHRSRSPMKERYNSASWGAPTSHKWNTQHKQ